MATIIIKNSTGSNSVPASLLQGELAVNTVTGKLFYGSGSGNAVREYTASLALTSSNGFPYSGSAVITGSLIVNNGTNNILTVDTINGNYQLNDGSGILSIDWNNRTLSDGNRAPLDWFNRYLQSSNADELSVDWENRVLYASDGTTAHLDWSNPSYMQLGGTTESPITNVLGIDGSGRLYYTASSAIGGGGASFPYTGSAIITGSLVITGSTTSTSGFTGSLFGTSSWAESASQALTASYVTGSIFTSTNPALSASYALTASYAANAGSTFNSTSSVIGNGLSSSFNINHGFNTRNLHITVYESSSNGETVYPDIRRINANTASIIFANPPTSNQYIVYISQ